jgi:hypothetical protein
VDRLAIEPQEAIAEGASYRVIACPPTGFDRLLGDDEVGTQRLHKRRDQCAPLASGNEQARPSKAQFGIQRPDCFDEELHPVRRSLPIRPEVRILKNHQRNNLTPPSDRMCKGKMIVEA